MKKPKKNPRVVFRGIAAAVSWGAALFLIVGLAVRLTVRDGWDLVAPIFYATPWFVLAAAAVPCLIHWWNVRRIRIATAIVLTVCTAMWIARSYRFGPRERPADSFRIAYWNIARPSWQLDGVLNEAESWNADAIVFGEHRPKGTTPPQWQTHFLPRHAKPLERELLIVTGEPPKITHGGSLGQGGGCEIATLRVQGRELFVLMVDFASWPRKSRRPAFERLYQIVDAYAEKPLIVVGDFNTPADSAHFDRLRTKLRGAFETAGRGYASTWPMPLPVLQLDHIWTNQHVRVVRCEHKTSIYSDHRAVVADIVFP